MFVAASKISHRQGWQVSNGRVTHLDGTEMRVHIDKEAPLFVTEHFDSTSVGTNGVQHTGGWNTQITHIHNDADVAVATTAVVWVGDRIVVTGQLDGGEPSRYLPTDPAVLDRASSPPSTWRLAGSPEPSCSSCGWSSVPEAATTGRRLAGRPAWCMGQPFPYQYPYEYAQPPVPPSPLPPSTP
jgi:hypothetical protein